MIVKRIKTKIGAFYYGITKEGKDIVFSLLDCDGEFIANVTPNQIEQIKNITHISELVDLGVFLTLDWHCSIMALEIELSEKYGGDFSRLDIINRVGNYYFVGDVKGY